MNVLVIGTGSIGCRHILNLTNAGCTVYAYSLRGQTHHFSNLFIQPVFLLDLADTHDLQLDAVVIANATHLHIQTALHFAEQGLHIYIEKPLSSSLKHIDRLLELVSLKKLIIECGFMLRSHPNLIHLKSILQEASFGDICFLRASVGQYLPDWRPNVDYTTSYSAKSSKGGGVLFDLIHEIDITNWLCGTPLEVSAITSKSPYLSITSEAVAEIGMHCPNSVVAQVHLDYLRPCYSRTLEIVCQRAVFTWCYNDSSLSIESPDMPPTIIHKCPPDFQRNTLFVSSLDHFLARIRNPLIPPRSSLSDSIEALRIALACHLSSSERRHVYLNEVSM